MRPADQEHSDFIEQQAEFYYLRGYSAEQIAEHLGVSPAYAYKLIAPVRELVAAGEYDHELAVLRSLGFTNVPTAASVRTKAGRPTQPLTERERAIRAAYPAKRIADIAREHSTYPQKIRAILSRNPSLLPAVVPRTQQEPTTEKVD